mgnify:CR=1 FL=1|tara:strand:- start:331 stop:579 length:249 start_codon:yes stop_codon:yes gene_type:complete
MKTTAIKLLALAALLASSSAFAFSCPLEIQAIDDALANNPQLSKSDLARVKGLRARGEALHKAGKHAKSVEVLEQARKMLGL